ncbi:phosphoribulokinase [Actinocorallia sp. A-T 12471]|uniref:phosphoribulokinase n=1 Tax=Actinocorallia sp. A-T 12471 TaxID=3089813 RepID=UPI0029D0ABF5|nr:phosphoribulokinase [Actinocorallia sp. A-T 12471]MDX6741427.1 phosphoribulokinase [Actinocorallia sp. A-T 12471]
MTDLAALLRAAPPTAGRTRVLAVDGRSGSGKSTLAVQAAALLAAPVVSLEDLYGGWDGLEAGVDRLVADVLVPLAEGRPAYVPRYDWHKETWEEPVVLDPPEHLVIEGVGAGCERAAEYVGVLVWIEVPEHVRKERALTRDGDTYVPYWDLWAAQEEAMLARERTPERADVVVRQ